MLLQYELSKIPFIRIIIPFIAGIITYIHFQLALPVWLYVFSGALLFGLIILLLINYNYKTQWVNGVVIYMLLYILGIAYTHTIHEHRYTGFACDDKEQVFVARIVSPPEIKEKTIAAQAGVEGFLQETKMVSPGEKIIMYFEKSGQAENIRIGDLLVCSGKLNAIENFGNPNEFNYKQYMAYNGIFHQVYVTKDSWQQIDSNKLNPVLLLSNQIRNYWLATYKRFGISDDRLSVLAAMTLGMKGNLDETIKASYVNSGALHVLAVSGLHVGIIYLFFGYLLSFLKKYKWGRIARGIILLVVVWFYALITGFPVSIFRAATMFSFIIVGDLLTRRANTFNSIFVSAFVVLLVNPYAITSVGFQLSYMAVIGIVFFQPRLYGLFHFKSWLPDKVYQLITVSLSAQLGVLPITLFYFNQFANYFLIVNIFIIPFAFTVVFMGVSILLFSFFDQIARILAIILDHILAAMNKLIVIIGDMPFAVSEGLYVNTIQVLLIYLMIVLITMFFVFRKHKYLSYALFAVVIFLMLKINHNINAVKTKQFYIYNSREGTIINCINGKQNILFSGKKILAQKEEFSKWYQKNWLSLGTGTPSWVEFGKQFSSGETLFVSKLCSENIIIQFYNTRYLVLHDKNIYNQHLVDNGKLNIDKIIITNNLFPDIEKLNQLFEFDGIVLDATNSFYTIKRWQEACKTNQLDLHVVSLQGAYSKPVG